MEKLFSDSETFTKERPKKITAAQEVRLQSYRMVANYDFTPSFIEFLDDLDWMKRRVLEKNIQEWVLAHNPQPKFIKGQRLVIESMFSQYRKTGEEVFVTGIKEKDACYLIHADEKFKGGTVIPYEKVEANCKASIA